MEVQASAHEPVAVQSSAPRQLRVPQVTSQLAASQLTAPRQESLAAQSMSQSPPVAVQLTSLQHDAVPAQSRSQLAAVQSMRPVHARVPQVTLQDDPAHRMSPRQESAIEQSMSQLDALPQSMPGQSNPPQRTRQGMSAGQTTVEKQSIVTQSNSQTPATQVAGSGHVVVSQTSGGPESIPASKPPSRPPSKPASRSPSAPASRGLDPSVPASSLPPSTPASSARSPLRSMKQPDVATAAATAKTITERSRRAPTRPS